MTNPEAIDPVDSRDGVRVLGAGRCLDLREQGDALVRRREAVCDNAGRCVIVMSDAERNAAPACRRILDVGDELACLLGRVDHGHHDALRPHVGRAGHLVVGFRRHTHDGRQIRCLEISDSVLDRFEPETGMFGVEEYEIAASFLEDVPDARASRIQRRSARTCVPCCGIGR